MNRTKIAAAGVCLLAGLGAFGACSSSSSDSSKSSSSSSSSSSASGDKAAFCATNADISASVNGVTSISDLPAAFKTVDSKLDDFLSEAPADVKTEATLLVTKARAAATSGDASAFTTAEVQAAGSRVDTFCGQNASSDSSSFSSVGSPVN